MRGVLLVFCGSASAVAVGSKAVPQGHSLRLLSPQLEAECEDACHPRAGCKICTDPDGQKCLSDQIICDDSEWASCSGAACPPQRQTVLCVNDSGDLCEQNLPEKETATDDSPASSPELPGLGAPEPPVLSAPKLPGPGACVSLRDGTTDFWCTTVCKTSRTCPANVCLCGEMNVTKDVVATGAWPPEGKTPAQPPPQENKGGENSTCVSLVPTTDDWWCQTTCATAACPPSLCKCGPEVVSKATASKGCDFDAPACVPSPGGTAPDCRSCTMHYTLCMSTPQLDESFRPLELTIENCIDQVAAKAEECKECATPESKEAYKVRMGYGQEQGAAASTSSPDAAQHQTAANAR